MAALDRPRIEYRTPVDLVDEVQRGELRIPPFQRGFKWDSSDVLSLFDSILQGYPIGNLLLWVRPAPALELNVGPVRIDAPAVADARWVVDGQQRITSLVGALVAADHAVDARFRIYLDLGSTTFRSVGIRQQPDPSWIPVNRLVDTATLLGWMRTDGLGLTGEQIELADLAAKRIREYQIPTYVVRSSDEQPLLEIFTRMNTAGKRLNKPEVFQALHAGLAGHEPHDLRSIAAVSGELGFGSLDERIAMRTVLALRGGDIFREDFHDEFSSDDDRRETFRAAANALREVIAFLQGAGGVPHVRLLPYSHVIPILARYVDLHGSPAGRAAVLLRRWIWRGAVAGTRARGVSVAAVRDQVAAATTDDPVRAASALLAAVPAFSDFSPELDKVHFSHAMTKISALCMLSAHPRDFGTEEPVDPAVLFARESPLQQIVQSGGPRETSIANRLVGHARPRRSAVSELTEASPEVAASHLVDREGQRLLAAGRAAEFLEHRAGIVAALIDTHIDRMAEWGARDGQALADLIRTVA